MRENDGIELYLKYRPKSFKDVVGQPKAVATLTELGKQKSIPHAILFTGPSGCGKTTLARILRVKLRCSDVDFLEINSSDARGIDDIRSIRKQVNTAPLGGNCRVWLIDEAHGMTGDAQNALLKVLEDTPRHAYFFLATTDPGKLKRTIQTRCTVIKCERIADAEIKSLCVRIAEREGVQLDAQVAGKIASVVDGSAREALVMLHAVLHKGDVKSQLEAVEAADVQSEAVQIARLLLRNNVRWGDVAKVLKTVKDEPEGIRHLVLGYCQSVLLGGGPQSARAALIMEEFRDNFFDSKRPGLTLACYNVVTAK